MDYGILNLGSLVLGLVAWTLPVINLLKENKAENKNWIILSVTSFIACSVSLFMQILYNNHLVNIEDWSALIDTSSAVSLVSAVLLVVTTVLNVLTISVYSKIAKRAAS